MAGRPSGPKTRCSGKWTEARFQSFIISNLRRASQKWEPIQQCMRSARVDRGTYRCSSCEKEVPYTVKDENGKRVKNVYVDHIEPIVDPKVGWTNWDDFIERMFVEIDGLQVLCGNCHTIKTNNERAIAKERRKSSNE